LHRILKTLGRFVVCNIEYGQMTWEVVISLFSFVFLFVFYSNLFFALACCWGWGEGLLLTTLFKYLLPADKTEFKKMSATGLMIG
jgi:hypothetical protein